MMLPQMLMKRNGKDAKCKDQNAKKEKKRKTWFSNDYIYLPKYFIFQCGKYITTGTRGLVAQITK